MINFNFFKNNIIKISYYSLVIWILLPIILFLLKFLYIIINGIKITDLINIIQNSIYLILPTYINFFIDRVVFFKDVFLLILIIIIVGIFFYFKKR